jgi:hypothetical protein
LELLCRHRLELLCCRFELLCSRIDLLVSDAAESSCRTADGDAKRKGRPPATTAWRRALPGDGNSRETWSSASPSSVGVPARPRCQLLTRHVRPRANCQRSLPLAQPADMLVPTPPPRRPQRPRSRKLPALFLSPAASNAFEERGIANLPLLSPRRQFAYVICLVCWSARLL